MPHVVLLEDPKKGRDPGLRALPATRFRGSQIPKALEARSGGTLWIAENPALALALVRALVERRMGARRDNLLFLRSPPAESLAILESVFDRVMVARLPPNELGEVLDSGNRSERCIGGVVDADAGVGTFYRGDLTTITVPLSTFAPSGEGLHPDFEDFGVTDYGATLRFGKYEAAFDAVLYEWDPQYRRKLKSQRLKDDRSFGASLRRLRKQRGLKRTDFSPVDARTIARIETGAVARPHGATLERIAKRLKVKADEIADF